MKLALVLLVALVSIAVSPQPAVAEGTSQQTPSVTGSSQPTAAEPTATQPTATQPTAAEPTAAEPTAAEPAVAEGALRQTQSVNGAPIIIGLTGGSAWGATDSRRFHEYGFTSERIEAGGPYTTIGESSEAGWSDDTVIVGNVADTEPLRAVNIAKWTAATLAQVREASWNGASLLEVGNEMYLKGACGEGCYQQKEPARYAEMYVSLSKAVEAAKIGGVKLLFDSFGDYRTAKGGRWSQVCCGGGWLASALQAQPELRQRVAGFTMHPYGVAGENLEDDWGPGALRAQHEQAVSLGFVHTEFYATEFGVTVGEAGPSGTTPLVYQAERIAAVFNELIGFGFVKGIWYFQAHDVSEGRYGLIEVQKSGSSPFVARPSLGVVSGFALAQEGPDTEAATGVTASTATLHGSLDPEGRATSYRFEYGATQAYGASAPATEACAGSAYNDMAVSQQILGLEPSKTYHFRLVADRNPWLVDGRDQTFTTSPPGPVEAVSPGTSSSGAQAQAGGATSAAGSSPYASQWLACSEPEAAL